MAVIKFTQRMQTIHYVAELQITVSHLTMSDLNRPMSDEILTLVGHYVQTNFFYQVIIK